MAERRLELGVVLAGAAGLGSVGFATYTVAHHRFQTLDDLWVAILYGLRRIRQDKTVRKLREEMGFYGYVRVIEVTHGQNGWHPHAHLLYFFSKVVTEQQRADLAAAEFRAWRSAAKKSDLSAPLEHCQKLLIVENAADAMGDYFSKSVYDGEGKAKLAEAGIDAETRTPDSFDGYSDVRSPNKVAFEMTGSLTKEARKDSRTPWVILRDFSTTGDLADLALWKEYENVSKGKRSFVYSQGLREMFEIEERSDEEIAEEELDGDKLFAIMDWSPIANDARLGALLLSAVRRGGFTAGRQFCDEHGIHIEVMPDCIGGGSDPGGP